MTAHAAPLSAPAQVPRGVALSALVLVIILVSLSAYLRLAHSGLGCPGWPACYGRIGEPPAASAPATSGDAYQRIAEQANEPLAWATPLHRLIASVLGVLILVLNFFAFRRRRLRVLSLALLGLTVFLAAIGIHSGSLHSPAVVMGNLVGGFCMLGLLGWLVASAGARAHAKSARRLRRWTLLALVLLGSQILLGGLTSANFAALACRSLPDCHGAWLPGPALATAFDLSREHEVNAQGIAIGGPERTAIHKAHRLGAVAALVALVASGLAAMRAGARFRPIGGLIVALSTLEFGVGVTAILVSLPLGLAVAHNWLAALLVLSLLKLLALNRPPAW